MKHFYKAVNKNSTKEMAEFLINHYTYDTMNSWNKLKSIANKVKVYDLPFKHDCYEVLDVLQDDKYFSINSTIKEWEYEHLGYVVGFNGRSGGYLVLYNKDNCRNILPDELTGDYDYFKYYCKEYYGGMKHYRDLKFYVELVQDFDKLCDELIDIADSLCEEVK